LLLLLLLADYVTAQPAAAACALLMCTQVVWAAELVHNTVR